MDLDLDLDHLAAVRVLGTGAMGTVFLVANRSPDRSPSAPPLFALKVVEKKNPSPEHASSSAKPDADRRARWEVSVLSRLAHPFLPSLLGRLETPDFLAWGVPYCPGGDLNALRHSQTDGVFSPAAIRFYLAELVLALAHLHSLGIVYRDLKPENVLIQASGHLTLTDFDLSRHLSPRPPSPATSSLPRPPEKPPRRHRRNLTWLLSTVSGNEGTAKKKGKSARVSPVNRRQQSAGEEPSVGERSNSFVGTEEYVSPEVVRGDGHEFAVDWWALGVLTYEMSYGRTPFRGRDRRETFGNILFRQPEFAGGRRSDLTDLIERLLTKDPVRRLGYHGGAEEVKAHPFLGGVRWELLTEVARPPFLIDDGGDDEGLAWATATGAGGDRRTGFSVGDYFKKLRQQQVWSPPGTPSPSAAASVSLTDF